jgi:hypothetical protein
MDHDVDSQFAAVSFPSKFPEMHTLVGADLFANEAVVVAVHTQVGEVDLDIGTDDLEHNGRNRRRFRVFVLIYAPWEEMDSYNLRVAAMEEHHPYALVTSLSVAVPTDNVPVEERAPAVETLLASDEGVDHHDFRIVVVEALHNIPPVEYAVVVGLVPADLRRNAVHVAEEEADSCVVVVVRVAVVLVVAQVLQVRHPPALGVCLFYPPVQEMRSLPLLTSFETLYVGRNVD